MSGGCHARHPGPHPAGTAFATGTRAMPYRVELREQHNHGHLICSPATSEPHHSLQAAGEAARQDAVEHAKAHRVDVRVQIYAPSGQLALGTQVRHFEVAAARSAARPRLVAVSGGR